MTGDEIEAEARGLILAAARGVDDPLALAVARDLVERLELAEDDAERLDVLDAAAAAMKIWSRRH